MQTSHLQSILHRNAALITSTTALMVTTKAEAKVSQMKASRNHLHHVAQGLKQRVKKLAEIQKAIKFDLHAAKLARLRANGHRRTKHGKDDPRYEAWATAQARAEVQAERYSAAS